MTTHDNLEVPEEYRLEFSWPCFEWQGWACVFSFCREFNYVNSKPYPYWVLFLFGLQIQFGYLFGC